ncbi:MAG: ribbon-helix-helix domain-containing protein [Candidatus Marsarchaeota archaeon]|nr:ribbon-helix-helix domain-containing protein [Candidatus Marsarchaeota archaeon]
MKTRLQNKRKYTTITIPAPLFERIRANIRSTGFSSVSDYVTYVMRETVSEMEMKKAGKAAKSSVMEKLQALGYA